MRRTGAMIVAAALLLGASSGCGTMLNMDGKEKLDFGSIDADDAAYVPRYQRPTFPFGGVANDVAWIKSATQPIDVVLSLADMPFSLVGDVVTFPWTLGQRPAQDRNDPMRQFWIDDKAANASKTESAQAAPPDLPVGLKKSFEFSSQK